MRKIVKSLLLITAFSISAHAMGGVNQVLVNETGLAYSKQYPLDTNAIGSPQNSMGKLSAQVTSGSATISNQTFSDGSQSTGSLTVVSTAPLVAASASDSITVPSTASILGISATNYITVVSTNGLGSVATATSIVATTTLTGVYVGINGSRILADSYIATTTSGTASALATALNALSGSTGVSVVWPGGTSNAMVATTILNGAFTGYTFSSSNLVKISSAAFSGGKANAVITVNGNIFTNQTDWFAAQTASGTASSIASALTGKAGIRAAWGGGTSAIAYTTATLSGTAGNAYTLASSTPAAISVGSTTFSGGAAPALRNAYFTLNGVNYRNGYAWTDVSGTSTGTAASIASFINGVSTQNPVAGGGLGSVTATRAGGVITLTSIVAGTSGNAVTLSATPSSGGLVIGSANFTGGRDNAYITINGTTLTLGIDFGTPTVSSTTANVATAIAAAINANATLAPLITAQALSSVITSTSDAVGLAKNYTTVSSTQSKLSFSNATMTGGTDSALTLNSGSIALPSHGFTTALPVLLSTGGATMGPLVNQTTYYVVVIDASHVGLSSTSAVAQIGNYLTITSTATQVSAHTVTLAPGTFIQGPAAGKWQVSNDTTTPAINWTDLSTSSSTFTPVAGGTTQVWDFGLFDYRWIRYIVVGPMQGAISLKVNVNAKD